MRHTPRTREFDRYLARIELFPLLDLERELSLARAYGEGEAEAGDMLISAHLRDVVAIARGYLGYGCPLEELVAEGNYGLFRSLENFDPERGLRFMTYASYWVRAQILEYVVKTWSLVSVGTSSTQRRLFFGLERERARMCSRGEPEGEDSVDKLARHFDCDRRRVVDMQQRLSRRDLSLERSDGDGLCLLDRLASRREDPERRAGDRQISALVQTSVAALRPELDERERAILDRRLMREDGPTLVDLGRELGISRERVRQLEERVRERLRRRLRRLADERVLMT